MGYKVKKHQTTFSFFQNFPKNQKMANLGGLLGHTFASCYPYLVSIGFASSSHCPRGAAVALCVCGDFQDMFPHHSRNRFHNSQIP